MARLFLHARVFLHDQEPVAGRVGREKSNVMKGGLSVVNVLDLATIVTIALDWRSETTRLEYWSACKMLPS